MNPQDEAVRDWITRHFDEQTAFLQKLVQTPSDTPPGNNTPHALVVKSLLESWGWEVEAHTVPEKIVHDAGMQSVTNLVIRRRYGPGPIIALNAHGDVVPPGEGWTVPPYAGEIHDGRLYGRAAAVSKSDFATYAFAVRALEACSPPKAGTIELHLTYDEEFGGLLGPGWLLEQKIVQPDYAICAGFSYAVVLAHNGCLQFEVTVNGKATHGAEPHNGIDALRAVNAILTHLYAEADELTHVHSSVPGISHPTLIVGQLNAGTNTNVVPGEAVIRLDRRLIPEEDPADVEARVRDLIARAAGQVSGIGIHVTRLLKANALKPLEGSDRLVTAIQEAAADVMGEDIPAVGTPLYADARLYAEHGVPVVLYGAGPRTLLESNAKRADEHVVLEDLARATEVVACALTSLLTARGTMSP